MQLLAARFISYNQDAFACVGVSHDNFGIAWPCAGDGSFKHLTYQL
jgi:hypothetical protein